MPEQYPKILKAVSQIAETLLKVPGWEDAMPSLLKQLGEAVDVSRAYLFECKNIYSDECLSNIRFEWVADTVYPQIDNPELKNFSWRMYDLLDWKEGLDRGEIIDENIEDFPLASREFFARQQIQSLLLVPILYDSQPWGFLGFDECRMQRKWKVREKESLSTVANILGGAIQRCESERKLRETNERYRLAEEAGGIGTWDWDIVTGELEWSESIESLFGFTEGEFGKTYEAFLESIHPEDRDGLQESVRASVEDGLEYDYQHRIIWPDGSVRWVQETGEVTRDEQGNAIRMVGVVQDITNDMQVHQALIDSEQRFRDLVESTSDWIWEVDRNGYYSYVSPKVEDVLGYQPEELIGKTPFDLMSPDEANRLAAIFGKIVADRAPISQLVNVNYHRDGHQVILETSGIPIIDNQGELIGYRGIDRDISHRVSSEVALKESQEVFRQLAEHVNEVFYVRDIVADSFVYVSPSYKRLLEKEVPLDKLKLQSLIDMVHPDDLELIQKGLIKQEQEGAGLDLEFRIVLHDGKTKWVWLRTFPIKNEEGIVYRIAGLVEDITSRKQAQDLRLQQEREHRNTLIREVHHRIKNNLQSIIGLLRLQLGDYPEFRGVLERVMAQVQSIALIHGLQGRRGTMYLCEVFHAIGEANRSFVMHNHLLEIDIRTMQPLVVREEDIVPIALIINELLTNAIKHSRPGKEKIIFQLSAEDENAVIRIQNAIPEQPSDSQVDTYAEGVGLRMVNALMPPVGAELRLDHEEGGYMVELTLSLPVVWHDQHMDRRPEIGAN